MIRVIVQDYHLTTSRLWRQAFVEVEGQEHVEEVTEVVVHVAGSVQLHNECGGVDGHITL